MPNGARGYARLTRRKRAQRRPVCRTVRHSLADGINGQGERPRALSLPTRRVKESAGGRVRGWCHRTATVEPGTEPTGYRARQPGAVGGALTAIPTPNLHRSTSTTSGCPGQAPRQAAPDPAIAAIRKTRPRPTGKPVSDTPRRPISPARAACAVHEGLPLKLDDTLGRRDIAVKAASFPIPY